MSGDSNGSPGQRPTRQQRHEQALRIIDRAKHEGSPFILYLRDFRAGERMVHPEYRGQKEFTIDDELVAQVAPEIGVVFVQSEAEERYWAQRPGHPMAPYGPSLQLADDAWAPAVEQLIKIAEVIFVDAPVLSEGTRFELLACLERKLDQTVLILPAPNFMRWRQNEDRPEADSADELVQLFPRVMWSDDFYTEIAMNFAAKDLIARARAIARLPPPDRMKFTRPGQSEKIMPVIYHGVLDGHLNYSGVRALSRKPWNPDPMEDNWERTFWGFHRAALTVHAMLRLREISPKEAARKLVLIYRQLVNLMGENLIQGGGIVIRGHMELARTFSKLAIDWAKKSGDKEQIKLCKQMLAEVEQRIAMIKAGKLVYGPILKALYVPDLQRVVKCPQEGARFY